MSILTLLYTEGLFRPLFNLLVGINNVIPGHNVGFAIIFVTIIVRLILLPPSIHQAKQMQKNQQKMGEVQKEIKKIKKIHKNDKTKQAEETMALYKKAGINPASGCLPLLIQLPILIALYRVFLVGMGPETFHYLYSFISRPESVQLVFLGISLTAPSLLFGVIAGAAQFIMTKISIPAPQQQPGLNDQNAQMMASMQKNMMYIFPVMTIFIALQLPAALSLYWVISTVFAIIQQYLIRKRLNITENIPSV